MSTLTVPGPTGPTARLLVAGDWHGNIDWVGTCAKLAKRHGCDGILQTGDFGLWPMRRRGYRDTSPPKINQGWLTAVGNRLYHQGVWCRFVDGNHDAHPLGRAAFPSGPDGVRPVVDGRLDWADRGATWTWCGIRFGALGGATSVDRIDRTEDINWWSTERPTTAEAQVLIDAGPLDVLVTHDTPIGTEPKSDAIDRRYAGSVESSLEDRKLIDEVVRACRPRLVLHGHWHTRRSTSKRIGDGLDDVVQIEGFAHDEKGNTDSWGILELPSLRIISGAEALAEHRRRPR